MQEDEARDDGNDIETDACRGDCREAACGDGVLRTGLAEDEEGYEACDDGNTVDEDGASRTANCTAAVMAWSARAKAVTMVTKIPTTNVMNAAPPAVAMASWRKAKAAMTATGMTAMIASPTVRPLDAVMAWSAKTFAPEDEGYEDCDDGNGVDGDGCTNACAPAQCGDGIIHAGAEAVMMATESMTTAAPTPANCPAVATASCKQAKPATTVT